MVYQYQLKPMGVTIVSMYLGPKLRLSKNFSLAELTIGHNIPGFFVPNLKDKHFVQLVILAQRLQTVRDVYDKRIIISSGFRTPEYNKDIGGSIGSFHLLAKAADIRPYGTDSINELWYIVNSYWGIGGIGDGRNKNLIHVDTRPIHANWIY